MRVSAQAPRVAEQDKPQAREVGAKKTPLAPAQIEASITKAYTALHGEKPSPSFVKVLSAQVFHETGLGDKMHNFNFGGIKGVSPEGMTAKTRTREVFDGKEVTIRDGFRAYSSATEGAKDYVAFLERRYPKAIEAAERGDAEGFVRSLKAGKYFTADEGAYTSAVKSLMQIDPSRHVAAPGATRELSSSSPFSPFPSSFSAGMPGAPGTDVSMDAVARALDGSWTSFSRITFDDGDDR